MSKKKDDLFCRFFDFNGDRKTSIDKEKGQYRGGILLTLVASPFLMILPIGVLYAAIKSYDERNPANGFVTLLFMIAGFIALGFVIRIAYENMRMNVLMLRRLKTNYLNSIGEIERARFLKKKKRTKTIFLSVVGAVLLILFSHLIANNIHKELIYKQAESNISLANYIKAKELLNQIKNKKYKDTEALLALCEAYDEYERGCSVDAYYALHTVVFHYQNAEQMSTIEQFKAMLVAEYDNYVTQKEKERQQEYYNKLTNGVPFVGMSEANISSTILGFPSSKMRHNYEYINGERYVANLYDFYDGSKKIFTARCVNGKVTEVWGERNTSSYVPNASSSKKTNKDSDPYDAKGYYHVDDFYYDHYDDFFDYEEAEDYYNEYNK